MFDGHPIFCQQDTQIGCLKENKGDHVNKTLLLASYDSTIYYHNKFWYFLLFILNFLIKHVAFQS